MALSLLWGHVILAAAPHEVSDTNDYSNYQEDINKSAQQMEQQENEPYSY